MLTYRAALGLFSLTILGCGTSPAPAPVTESGAYVIRLGSDTVAAESYTRVGNRIDGVVMRRVPRTVIVRYVLLLQPSGMPSTLRYNTRLPDGSMLPNGAQSVQVTFTGDSAITDIVRDSVVTRRVPARDAFPEIDDVVSLFALPIRVLTSTNRDSATFRAYAAGTPRTSSLPVARKGRGAHRFWLYSFGDPIEITTDDRGRVISVDASRTTYRIRTERQESVDVAAVAIAFAERERQTGPIGALSPRDTVNAVVAGARLLVDYSRPAKRGRTIFGPSGVLGDTLWRTGANAATRFRTDVALSVAGRLLPAGRYSLMTLAIPERYQLIFYQDDREFMRVPLQARRVSPAIERFTIAIEATSADAGAIRLLWDTMELSVPFTVR